MKAAHKYMFDVDFDEEESTTTGHHRKGGGSNANAQQQEAPVFTEDDVNAARTEAFAQGKEEGIAETRDSLEARLAETVDTLLSHFSGVVDAQVRASEQMHKDAVSLTAAFMRKLFPYTVKDRGIDEIAAMTEMAVGHLVDEPRIVVRVSETLTEPLKERLQPLIAGRKTEDSIIVSGDPDLALGDCSLEWSDGAAERNQEKLWAELDQIIEKYLSQELVFPAKPGPGPASAPPEAADAADEQAPPQPDSPIPADEISAAPADAAPMLDNAITDPENELPSDDPVQQTSEIDAASGDQGVEPVSQEQETVVIDSVDETGIDLDRSEDPSEDPNGELPQ